MKIRAIRTRAVAAPMKRPLVTSIATLSVAPLLLIDLETDAGIVGRSYLFGLAKHHLPTIAELVKAMAAMVEGDEVAPFDLERKLRARYALLGVHNIVLFAMSGIDMAAWTRSRSRSTSRSCACSARRRARCPPTTPRARPASRRQAGARSERARRRRLSRDQAAAGKAFGARRSEALKAVKKQIGSEVTLMVDFNQGLTVAEAIRRGRMIDDEGGVYWIEEPIRADDFAGVVK